jgi:tetratricopeptide (TPR) repeat protein
VNERAVRLRPDDEQAHAQLGYGYLLVGRLAEAETHLKITISLDPAHYFYPQILLADIYGQRSDRAGMVRELEEFLRLHPDSQKARDVAQIVDKLRSEFKKPSISSP